MLQMLWENADKTLIEGEENSVNFGETQISDQHQIIQSNSNNKAPPETNPSQKFFYYRDPTIKKYRCNTCSFTSVNKHNTIRHVRIHTGEKPYRCDVCPQSFSDRTSLNYHVRYHTGEKPHVCNFCQKAYVSRSQLIYHIRTHTGEKPFKCPFCDYATAMNSSLKRHLSTHRNSNIENSNSNG